MQDMYRMSESTACNSSARLLAFIENGVVLIEYHSKWTPTNIDVCISMLVVEYFGVILHVLL